MSMIPGLHPNTRPQRKGEQGAWALAARDEFEARDAPARSVAVGLAGIMALMLLSVAGALAFVGANRPRIPLPAEAAKARFHSAGPPLETASLTDRLALAKAHPPPDGQALEAAMAAVVRQGWGEPAPPPSRADIALSRARSGR